MEAQFAIRMLSQFARLMGCAVASVLLLHAPLVADPNTTVAAPASSNIKQSIQRFFQQASSMQNPIVEDDSLFSVELASLEYAQEAGQSLDTNTYKSKKVLVYFWSIYCRGCIAPMRELEQLRGALRESDIEIVTVHLFESDRARLLNRLTQMSLGLPVLFGADEIRDLFSVRVLPTAVMFDDSHQVIARIEGGFEESGLSLKVTKEITSTNLKE